jgi:hypothetical protein
MKGTMIAIRSFLRMTEAWAKRRQVHGHWPSSRVGYQALCLELFVLLIVIAGCGGGPENLFGGPGPIPTVTVSPSTVTMAVNTKVTLQASLKGQCAGCLSFINSWTVAENNNALCLWGGVNDPPPGPCPAGTILQNPPAGNTLIVTYYAPDTPGTYHVTAEYDNLDAAPSDGTSVITVTP